MALMDVSLDAEDALPLAYDPAAIAGYWDGRPVAVAQRIVQLLGG